MKVEPQAGASSPHPGLQECLGSMLRAFERTVGFAEGVVMAFDPDVLLPTAFAATVERGFDDALVACRNEQLDDDFLKFRDLATGPVQRPGRETSGNRGQAARSCMPPGHHRSRAPRLPRTR